MSGSETWQLKALPSRFVRAAVSAYNERRSTSERLRQLEHEIAEERQSSETLRNTITELRFQLETLEKTYAKQLTDARERIEATEAELAERQTQLDSLEGTHDEALRSLSETRAELERVKADRELLRTALASSDALEVDAVRKQYAEARYHAGFATTDELMNEAPWPRAPGMGGDAESPAPADGEARPADMIAPDLVFADTDAAESDPDT